MRLPAGGALELIDLESGRRVLTSPDAIADDYGRRVDAFLRNVKERVEREGLDYVRLLADEPLEPVLRRFLITRRGGH